MTQLVRNFDSVFMREGRLAVERAISSSKVTNAVAEGGAAFCAIVCAAGAVEAYLSEILAHHAEVGFISHRERQRIQSERGVARKYLALVKVWRGDLAADPVYPQLTALVCLRNCVVHRSAEFRDPGVWPTEVAPHKKLIPHVSGEALDWTSQVLAAVTAQWAVDTAWDFLKRIDEYVPDPSRTPFVDGGTEQPGTSLTP